ncbi:aldolase catalytic domain-containing protein [bacterium]|nr:aldolase catalytic domain-containing protein [bacterium]
MKKVELLDCTLRDGGSLNNWKFGEKTIIGILQSLNDSRIDIIEAGFIDNNSTEDNNSCTNPTDKYFNQLCKKIKNKNCKAYAMIDFSKYDIKKFNIQKKESLDGIRIMFKKHQLNDVVEFCKKLKKLNYEISLNPVSVTTYSKNELLNLINEANKIEPQILYIVDTYGLLSTKETIELFNIFNKHLNKNIKIGYHVHNNLQLALANSIEVIKVNNDRNIVIDASLYGMGKRAGNTPIESLSLYLNNNFEFEYDTNRLIKAIEKYILPLKTQYTWGYSLVHYIASINKCHSDYVTYLYKENNLSLDEIHDILKKIPKDKKLTFDKNYLQEYTKNKKNDKI